MCGCAECYPSVLYGVSYVVVVWVGAVLSLSLVRQTHTLRTHVQRLCIARQNDSVMKIFSIVKIFIRRLHESEAQTQLKFHLDRIKIYFCAVEKPTERSSSFKKNILVNFKILFLILYINLKLNTKNLQQQKQQQITKRQQKYKTQKYF